MTLNLMNFSAIMLSVLLLDHLVAFIMAQYSVFEQPRQSNMIVFTTSKVTEGGNEAIAQRLWEHLQQNQQPLEQQQIVASEALTPLLQQLFEQTVSKQHQQQQHQQQQQSLHQQPQHYARQQQQEQQQGHHYTKQKNILVYTNSQHPSVSQQQQYGLLPNIQQQQYSEGTAAPTTSTTTGTRTDLRPLLPPHILFPTTDEVTTDNETEACQRCCNAGDELPCSGPCCITRPLLGIAALKATTG